VDIVVTDLASELNGLSVAAKVQGGQPSVPILMLHRVGRL